MNTQVSAVSYHPGKRLGSSDRKLLIPTILLGIVAYSLRNNLISKSSLNTLYCFLFILTEVGKEMSGVIMKNGSQNETSF